MSISRLLNYPATIVQRTDGPEDSWGSPTTIETDVPVECYYRQMETTDNPDTGTTDEIIEVFIEDGLVVTSQDAVKIDLGRGSVELFEVVGPPAPELNARLGAVNHLRITARRALP